PGASVPCSRKRKAMNVSPPRTSSSPLPNAKTRRLTVPVNVMNRGKPTAVRRAVPRTSVAPLNVTSQGRRRAAIERRARDREVGPRAAAEPGADAKRALEQTPEAQFG